jgi:hypothetical protein
MRIKTINRTATNEIQQSANLRNKYWRIVHQQYQKLFRAQKELEREIDNRKYFSSEYSNDSDRLVMKVRHLVILSTNAPQENGR